LHVPAFVYVPSQNELEQQTCFSLRNPSYRYLLDSNLLTNSN
jgi:hypothetical protein